MAQATAAPPFVEPSAHSLFPGLRLVKVGPAFYLEARRTWIVSRYHEVQHVLLDYRTFSSRRGGLTPATTLERNAGANMITMDPPQHQQHRMHFNEAFFQQAIAHLAPQIEADAHALLDRVIERGTMDLIDDFAHQLSLNAITKLLGIPIDDPKRFRQLSDVEISSPGSENVQYELELMLAPILKQRQAEPRDDLISVLVAPDAAGNSLSAEEIISSCGLLLMAGHRSSRNLIGNAVLCLNAFPEVKQQVLADPALQPGFLEEVIRYLPAFLSAPRIATTDTVVGTTQIEAGQWVMPQIAAANRDPAVFADPDVFNIRRIPNPHISFGHGVHHCVAQPLARLDTTIALKVLFERLADIQVIYEEAQPVESPVVYGMRHLPVTFQKA